MSNESHTVTASENKHEAELREAELREAKLHKWFEPDWVSDKRRKPWYEKKSWMPKQLWARHHEIKRRLLLGQSNKQIAEALGIHPQTVSWVRNSPVMQEELKKLNEERDRMAVDLRNQILELAPLAIEHYKRCLQDSDNELYSTTQQLKVAGEVLDRSGLSPRALVSHQHLHAHLSAEDIEEIKRRARESGLLVDARQSLADEVGDGDEE